MEKNHHFLLWGLTNLLSPVPLLILGIQLDWFLFFGIGFDVWGYENIPQWYAHIPELPIFLLTAAQVISSVWGIVSGARHRKEEHAVWCIVLSAAGIVIQSGIWFLMLYIGSHF